MLFFNGFLEILLEANEASPKLAGQLFVYHTKLHKFDTLRKHSSTNPYQYRWLFLLTVVAIMILRNVYSKKDYSGNGTAKSRLSTMMIILVLVVVEHYRIRGFFAQDYISFLNAATFIERKYDSGN